MNGKVRVGVVGTSWWADAMYLPAITRHSLAEVRGVVGSRPEHTHEFAERWGIPGAYDTLDAMLASERLDALLVLVPNRLHHPMTMAAIKHGLHVLCEKPLGMSSIEAREMTEAAERAGVITMVPFTYWNMPAIRYLKELVDEGYLGRPYHLDMRYFADYGRQGDYQWRFDLDVAGSGVAADLGSHWVYLARSFFGEVKGVTAVFGKSVPRVERPEGGTYRRGEDSAIILLDFENGATGSLHVSAVAYEPSAFGQLHAMELHGSSGTLHHVCDWNDVQRVDGARVGEPRVRELPIPDRLFDGVRRTPVHDTYKDVFRDRDFQARAFITAVAAGRKVAPDFADGLAVQRIVDAAARSARDGRRTTIAEITADEAG
jgi:predicted dehydrogenase